MTRQLMSVNWALPNTNPLHYTDPMLQASCTKSPVALGLEAGLLSPQGIWLTRPVWGEGVAPCPHSRVALETHLPP